MRIKTTILSLTAGGALLAAMHGPVQAAIIDYSFSGAVTQIGTDTTTRTYSGSATVDTSDNSITAFAFMVAPGTGLPFSSWTGTGGAANADSAGGTFTFELTFDTNDPGTTVTPENPGFDFDGDSLLFGITSAASDFADFVDGFPTAFIGGFPGAFEFAVADLPFNGTITSASGTLRQTPVPATAPLAIAGLGLLAALRRRRR
jgi:MYXO-CTERM domain-containing protein